MYRVFDNNKPARYPDCKVDPSWSQCDFNTFEEAQAYANNWLGVFGGVVLEEGVPLDYSGYGSYIEIRKLEIIC